MAKKKKSIVQCHHVVYGDERNKEVVRRIRKGVHAALKFIRRFNYLTPEEIDTIKIEAELKRKYNE
jgi:hypothetical protein